MSGGNIRLLSTLADAQALVQTVQIASTQSKASRQPTTTASSSSSSSSSSSTSAINVTNLANSARTDSRTNQNSYIGSKYSNTACSINDSSCRGTGSSSSSGSGTISTYSEYHERASDTYAVLIRGELNQLVSSLRDIQQSSFQLSDHFVDPIIQTICEEIMGEGEEDNEEEKENDKIRIIIREILHSIVTSVSSQCAVTVDGTDLPRVKAVTDPGFNAVIPPSIIPVTLSPFSSVTSSTSATVTATATTTTSVFPSSSAALPSTSTTQSPVDTTNDTALLPLPLPLPSPNVIATYWGHSELSDTAKGQSTTVTASSSSSSSSSGGVGLLSLSSSSVKSFLLPCSQSSHYHTSSQKDGTDSTSILPESSCKLYSMKDLTSDEEVDLIEYERKRGKVTLLDHLYLQDECGLGLYVLCDSDDVLYCDPQSSAKPDILPAELNGITVTSQDNNICDQEKIVDDMNEINVVDSVVKEMVENVVEENMDEEIDTGADAEHEINNEIFNAEEDVKDRGLEYIDKDQNTDNLVEEIYTEVECKDIVVEENIEGDSKNVELVEINTDADVVMDIDINVSVDMNGGDREALEGANMSSKSSQEVLIGDGTLSTSLLCNRSEHSVEVLEGSIPVDNYSESENHIQESSLSDTHSSIPIPHASTYRKDTSYVPVNRKSILVRVGDSLSERTFPSTVPQSPVAMKASRITTAEAKLRAIQKLEENLEKNLKYSKKRKKNKEKKKKESEIPENLFHDSPVPKKVPRQVIENIKPHHINLTHLPSPLPLTQCIQKYTADFTIEKYSFFDQVCSFYEKKKKKMKLIGKKYLSFD